MAIDAQRLDRNGWLVGVFFDGDVEQDVRASRDLEVKYWSYPAGGGAGHSAKRSSTTEWSVILQGKVRSHIASDHVVLEAGDYVLIQPGTPNNLVAEVLEDVVAITVKAPSDPTAKAVLPDDF